MTGSRFPNPGYSISSKTIDLTRNTRPLTNPDSGKEADDDPDHPAPPKEEQIWHVDARQNFYWGGPIPFFFLAEDQRRPGRPAVSAANDRFNSVNYFGQQLKTD